MLDTSNISEQSISSELTCTEDLINKIINILFSGDFKVKEKAYCEDFISSQISRLVDINKDLLTIYNSIERL